MDNLILTQKLNELVSKLEQFFDGNEDTVITTSGGILPSIRGLIKEIKRTRPVQYIPEFTSIPNATLDTSVQVGDVVRIKNTGYYQKNNLGGFDKVSYSDLYDLRDVVQNPKNHASEIYSQEQSVISCDFPTSGLLTSHTSFLITLVATSKDPAVTNSIQKKYEAFAASKDVGQIQCVLTLVSTSETWPRNDLTFSPRVTLQTPTSTTDRNTVTLSLNTAKIGVDSLLYDYSIFVENIDTKFVKMIRRL